MPAIHCPKLERLLIGNHHLKEAFNKIITMKSLRKASWRNLNSINYCKFRFYLGDNLIVDADYLMESSSDKVFKEINIEWFESYREQSQGLRWLMKIYSQDISELRILGK